MDEPKKMGRPPTGRQKTFSVTLPDKLRAVIEEDAKKKERSIAGQIRHILLTHYKVEA
jgi:hypothetical protein